MFEDLPAEISQIYDDATPAPEYSPVPPGEYPCNVVSGSRCRSTTGTHGYLIEFQITSGDHAGRKLRLRRWLTKDAMPMAKRDLLKVGITTLSQIDQPIPNGITATVQVVGDEHRTEVRSFTVQ